MNLTKIAKTKQLRPIKEPRKIELEYYKELKKLANQLKADVNEHIIANLKSYEVTQDNAFGALSMLELLRQKWQTLRTEQIASNVTEQVNRANRQKFMSQVNQATGIDIETLVREENLTEIVALQRQKQKILIKSIPEEFLKSVEVVVTNGLANGLRPEEIARQLKGIKGISSTFGKLENRVKMIARNEIATMNGNLTKARAQNAGITKAIWVTSRDERVRDCHRVRDGKEFELSKGLYSACDGKTLLPGQDFNCRCVMILKLEE